MDHPGYSDPILIPITLTIPDPRWQPQGGRWDHGSSFPPIHSGYGRVRPEDRAAVTFSPATERRLAILAQYTGAGLVVKALPAVVSEPELRWEKKFIKDAARAARRIREIAEEASRGEVGVAMGHLFSDHLYPGEIDTGFAPLVVHNEQADPPAQPRPNAETELDKISEEAERDLERRLTGELDERHLQAAENDRLGKPVVIGGRVYQHEPEVAAGKKGLETSLGRLKRKLEHEELHGNPTPSEESILKANKTIKKIDEVLEEIERRLPGLKVNQ